MVVVIPSLLKAVSSTRILMFLGLAFAFSITNMAALSKQFGWHEEGSLKIQVAVFCMVFLVSGLLFHLNFRKPLYIICAVYFISTGAIQAFAREDASSNSALIQADTEIVDLVDSNQPVVTPGIYLLVYDAYVTNETMLSYGIDNRSQELYLEELGFQLYPNAYSVAASSNSTMGRVLNASVDFYGNPRRSASGDGIVQNLLKGLGYKTYGVFSSDYYFRGIAPGYDHSFPSYSSWGSAFVKAILIGEFRFDIDFDKVPGEQFVEQKIEYFSQESEVPKFIFMHSNLPAHSQNSGACLPNEVQLFSDRLAEANLEMRQDVEAIIANDPKAVVIVAGDHGPYLTKNCTETSDLYDVSEISRLDIQDRFGTFLAVKWPEENFSDYDDIVVLQDLFPSVFAYIFQDPKLLESKIDPVTLETDATSGAAVNNGVINGGINDGEPLFTSRTDK